MALGLRQAELDQFAAQMVALLPAELVTYVAKATLADSGTTYTDVVVYLDEYRLSPVLPETILPTDLRARIPTAAVTWTPSAYDVITRADGSTWRVQRPSGGWGHAFWTLQLREE